MASQLLPIKMPVGMFLLMLVLLPKWSSHTSGLSLKASIGIGLRPANGEKDQNLSGPGPGQGIAGCCKAKLKLLGQNIYAYGHILGQFRKPKHMKPPPPKGYNSPHKQFSNNPNLHHGPISHHNTAQHSPTPHHNTVQHGPISHHNTVQHGPAPHHNPVQHNAIHDYTINDAADALRHTKGKNSVRLSSFKAQTHFGQGHGQGHVEWNPDTQQPEFTPMNKPGKPYDELKYEHMKHYESQPGSHFEPNYKQQHGNQYESNYQPENNLKSNYKGSFGHLESNNNKPEHDFESSYKTGNYFEPAHKPENNFDHPQEERPPSYDGHGGHTNLYDTEKYRDGPQHENAYTRPDYSTWSNNWDYGSSDKNQISTKRSFTGVNSYKPFPLTEITNKNDYSLQPSKSILTISTPKADYQTDRSEWMPTVHPDKNFKYRVFEYGKDEVMVIDGGVEAKNKGKNLKDEIVEASVYSTKDGSLLRSIIFKTKDLPKRKTAEKDKESTTLDKVK